MTETNSSDAAATGPRRRLGPWSVGLLAGALVAWPLAFAMLLHGPRAVVPCLTGDAYHYLAIARKATTYGFFSYDGIAPTNGFHPLWQWTLTALFRVFDLTTHEHQAVAAVSLAGVATTVGVILTSAAIVRITASRMMGLLVVPGVYYLAAGAHVRNLSIWSAFDGMESAFSVLFGGVLFHVFSTRLRHCATPSGVRSAFRAAGLVIPFVVLSRLDDVFLLPGLFLGLFCVQMSFRERLTTALWAAAPTGVVLVAYLVHNQCTVGSAMPLSGATKAGFVGHVNAWLGAAVHMGPLLDLRHAATGAPASGVIVFNNSFRLVELLYPAAFGLAACAVVWSYCRARAEAPLLFGLSAYLVLKAGYNTLFVNPWHQSSWYYLLAMQCVTVVASVGLARGWRSVSEFPWVRRSLAAAHTALALLVGSQFYAAVVYHGPGGVEAAFWRRSAEIRSVLSAAGVRGVVNFDDGISAFLLDLPNVHGFGFATDVEAQRSLRAASLLGLAHARGLDCLTGYTYLCSDTVPRTDGEIREFLRASKVTAGLRDDLDRFSFELLHYDPVLRLPFIRFTPRR